MWRTARIGWGADAVGGAGVLLGVWILLTLMGYLWWNLRYVQHQGRYLFPAIVPIGVMFSVGAMELIRTPLRFTLPLLGVPAAALGVHGAVRGDLPGTALALLAAAAVALVVGHTGARRRPGRILAAWYGIMSVLTVVALYWFVVPGLSP